MTFPTVELASGTVEMSFAIVELVSGIAEMTFPTVELASGIAEMSFLCVELTSCIVEHLSCNFWFLFEIYSCISLLIFYLCTTNF